MNYSNKIRTLLKKLPHKIQVLYAYKCALSVKDKLDPNDKASLECLKLIALWLTDSSLVNSQMLSNTASYASYAAVASYAANAANAAYASYAAANAANTASYAAVAAAYASSYATNASSYAATNSNNDKPYYDMLVLMLNDMTEVEKLIYRIEEEK